MVKSTVSTTSQKIWRRGTQIWCAMTFIFLLLPIVIMLPFSFSSGSYLSYPLPGFSLEWYSEIFRPYPVLWTKAFKNSLLVALPVTVLATVLGTLAAYGLMLSNFRGKGVLFGLIISPLAVPLVITALASYFFFAKIGLIATFTGLIISHTVIAVPFVILTVTATLAGFDRNLEKAATSLGVRPITVFRTITLPLIAPGVATGAIFAFVTSWDELVIALFVAGPDQFTLPRMLYLHVRDHVDPSAVAVAMFLIIVSALLLVSVELLRLRSIRQREPVARD